MKKLIVTLFALCIPFVFTACDKPVRKSEITGKWVFSKVTATPYGGPSGLEGFLNELVKRYVQVEADATYTFKIDKTGSYKSSVTPGETFTYSISGNELKMVMDSDPKDIRIETIQSITNAQMVWSDDITEEINAEMQRILPGIEAFDKVLGNKHFDRK